MRSSIGNGLLVRNVVRALDSSYSELYEFIPPDMPPSEENLKTDSAKSQIAWDGIGAAWLHSHSIVTKPSGYREINSKTGDGTTSRLCWSEFSLDARGTGSPAWLPVFRDSSLFRFRNQNGPFKPENAAWGPMRFAYLQYGSDPIVFLDTKSAWRSPAWLNEPRAPDVAPELRWIPLITFLQTAYDAMTATSTPSGTCHVYDAGYYLAAWQSVIEPQDWSDEDM